MLRNRRIWLVGLLLIVVVGGALAYYTATTSASETASDEQELQTTVVRRGEIIISAIGAGTVIPASEIQLSFGGSGVLQELLVRVGDEVLAGEVMARLDDTDAQEALQNSQLQLKQAEMKTDASVTETGVSFDDISVEQARLNLETAQSNLDELLNWEPDEDEIALAEANLSAAEASYNAARGQEAANSSNITVNNISVDQAERNLASAQETWDTAYDPGRDWELGDPRRADRLEAERAAADEALLRAQESLTIAQANLNAAVSSTSSSSSANARSNLLSAELNLEAARTGPTEDEIEAAELAVRQAELNLQQALLNRESNALTLAQSQLSVAAAEHALEETELIAPGDGTVMAINASVGESVSGAIIILADLEQPLIEVYLDETDLNMVGLGYEVEVVFDALPDEVFTGQVVQIDPQLTTSSGVTAVRALVQLNPDSFAKPQTLPVGLNATVEVIGGRAENALLVPVEALRELSAGEYAVFVMEDGEPKLRLVDVGLMDFTFAEIVSGLELGDTVTTGIVETN